MAASLAPPCSGPFSDATAPTWAPYMSANVDAITRARLQELAARLLRGRTVLQVTHDPLEALRLGHNIHVMAGRPAHLGPVTQPPGATPRDPTDPALRELHSALLAQLSSAMDEPSNGGGR